MTDENPYKIESPEFLCSAPREYSLEAEVAISSGQSGDKWKRYSTLTFRVDQMGGYPMQIAVRRADNNEWVQAEDLGEICIRFGGDYEAHTLQEFFQHVGLMMTPVYGQLNTEE